MLICRVAAGLAGTWPRNGLFRGPHARAGDAGGCAGGSRAAPTPGMLLRKMGVSVSLSIYLYVYICTSVQLKLPRAEGGVPTPPGGEDNNPGVPAGIFTREATPGDFPFVPVRIGLFRNKNYQDPRPPTPLPSLRRWMNGEGGTGSEIKGEGHDFSGSSFH